MFKVYLFAALLIGFFSAALIYGFVADSQVHGQTLNGGFVDSSSGLPLTGEIGASFRIDGRLHFRHVFADNTGRFSIDGLPATAVNLVTKVDDYASETVAVTENFGTTPIEFRLVKLVSVSGSVRNHDGREIAGVVVRAIPEGSASEDSLEATYSWQTGDSSTNENGDFSIGVHPQRSFVLEASHPDFLASVLPPQRIQPGEPELRINITLGRGVTVTGRVVDTNSNPISGAVVHLRGGVGRPRYAGFMSTEILKAQSKFMVTAADGRFTFNNVTPTRRRLTASRQGVGSATRILEVGPGSGPEPVEIILR